MTKDNTRNQSQHIYPVPKKSIKRISYKESPYHVKDLKHAVDFIVDEGTPVYASMDGIILDFKDDSAVGGKKSEYEDYGNFIEIKHDNDEISEYEHLRYKGVLVKKGQRVTVGEQIGWSGATGVLAHLGAHLHFMVGKYEFRTIPITFQKEGREE